MTQRQITLIRHLTFLVAAFSLFLAACSGKVQPSVTAGIDACAQCNMIIDTVNQSCGYMHDSEFVTFDSPGCLLKSYDEIRQRGVAAPQEIYFADYESSQFVPAGQTFFLLTDHISTVMDAGVLCFLTADGAEGMRTEADGVITDWTGFRRVRGRPDTIVEATITADGLAPEIIEVSKGALVLVKFQSDQLAEITLSVRGYPEIGEIVVLPSEEPTELRFFATKPGAGFPVIGKDDQALGMIRVTGAHTMDEEAM